MRRVSDFPGLTARVLLVVVAMPCLGAGLMWLVRANDAPRIAPVIVPRAALVALAPRDFAIEPVGTEELFEVGRRWWEDCVPAEIKAQYAFPSMDEIRGLLGRIEEELADGSAAQLAAYERDARRALKTLHRFEGGDVLAAWLEPRMDLLKAAAQIEAAPMAAWPSVTAAPSLPSPVSPDLQPSLMVPLPAASRPQFTRGYWDNVLVRRQPPRRAAAFVPQLKEIFRAAGVPAELVWIAEVESSMNPEATSPVGARGLFQFMPMTAARFGLDTGVLVDERTDPEKSARAAAAYLRVLHRRFLSWPLAIAAYNAGEGRVGRALKAENVTTYEAVAHRLPLETRMYVPKVMATVAARESIDPEALPPPQSIEAVRAQFVSDEASDLAEVATAAPTSL